MRIKDIFHKNKIQAAEDELVEARRGGDYGIHFPRYAIILLIMAIISEITDIYLLKGTIGKFNTAISNDAVDIISVITGILCFGSMAAIGYQSANTRVKYQTKKLEVCIWFAIGLLIASMRVFLTVISNVDSPRHGADIATNIFMALLQFLLYISSGFMSYTAAKQITNGKFYEYWFAKHVYEKLIKELEFKRKFISGGLDDLAIYPEYVARLQKSKGEVLNNVGLYNKSTRAMCEAKMSIITEPDQMDAMYEDAKIKEIKENGQWAATDR